MEEYCNEPNCGTCVRRDVDEINDTVNLVNYVGEYVIQTRMAPECDIAQVALMLAFGGPELEDFPIYFTLVGHVGDESASIADSRILVDDGTFLRWYQRHNDDDAVRDAHQIVVEAVRAGSLDLSTPVTMEAFREESETLGRKFGLLSSE